MCLRPSSIPRADATLACVRRLLGPSSERGGGLPVLRRACRPAEQQKAFWLQFQDPARPQVFGDKLKQLAELQRAAKPAMEDLCKALWPRDPLPTSFFGLVRRLQGAGAQADLWKRSACLEGARQAFAAVQAHYPKLDGAIARQAPRGMAREVKPEKYFEKVMPAARIAEEKCKRESILENLD